MERFLPAEKVRSIGDEFKLTPVQLGLALLPVAACYSHTPISEFHVGAIAIGESGDFTLVRIKNFRVVAWLKPSMLNKGTISHAWLRNEPSHHRYRGELHALRSLPSIYE